MEVHIVQALKDGGLMTIQTNLRASVSPSSLPTNILKNWNWPYRLQISAALGGAARWRDLADVTLYDVIRATDEEFFSPAVSSEFRLRIPGQISCTIHRELAACGEFWNPGLRAFPWRICWARRTRAASVHLNQAAPGSQALFCP